MPADGRPVTDTGTAHGETDDRQFPPTAGLPLPGTAGSTAAAVRGSRDCRRWERWRLDRRPATAGSGARVVGAGRRRRAVWIGYLASA